MINKHSIYNWLFFPLLVFLLAGSATSCSNDPAMEEEKTSGKTTLSITVRGVTQEPEKDGYDEYIKTLRLIVFDASGLVCNEFYNQEAISEWTVMGDGANTYYDITQELQNFSGGNCRFYFIANEEGYTVYGDDNTSLTDLLSKDGLTEDELKKCMMASTPDNQDWSNKPILMIANPSAQYIRPGDNIEITDVELVRCIAKVQLIVQKDNTVENKIPENDVVTISDVSLHGSRPESYTLWENGTIIAGTEYSRTLLGGTDSENVGYSDSPYSSGMVYFPEMLYQNNTTEVDLYFTFTLTYTPAGSTAIERTYTVAIGKDADNNGVVDDCNIYRNTVYTVTATLQWQPTEPTMNIQVDAWDGEVKVDVPDFE
ncbi:MAG: fimbrial protein [Bacteroides sp.]|nr:fimbrial protein [Bacteroides sp.]